MLAASSTLSTSLWRFFATLLFILHHFFLDSLLFIRSTLTLHIRRWRQLLAPTDPYLVQLVLNLLPPILPLLDLRQPFPQLSELLFNRRLLGLGADALEFPFIALLAETKG